MKCSKCGAVLTYDTKFCSYCGQKVEESEKASPFPPITDEEEEPEEKANNNPVSPIVTNSKPSNADRIKWTWTKLSKFGKISTVGSALFVLLGLVAFLTGKIFAGIIAVVQIAIVVVALLMKKEIIKVPKNWISILSLILSFVLLVPYVCLFNVDMSKTKQYKWSDIVLSDVIPEPKSHYGEISSNSNDYLSLYVYRTNATQYNYYMNACKDKGFTIDIEQTSSSYYAYNESGYKLSLTYDESDKEMYVGLAAAMKLGTIIWSENEFAKLVPVPRSTVGKIEKDDKTGFVAYVGETSVEDYNAYVKACSDKGFSVDAIKTDKHFSAKNENSYKITVDYQGNNIMCISVYEPEYDVSIEVDCVENWIFSKYDVKVYVDDSSEGTLKNGGTETYDVTLKKGTHTIRFESAEDGSLTGKVKVDISKNETLKFKISCTSSSIDVETISGTSSNETSEVKPSDSSAESYTTSTEENVSSTESSGENTSQTDSPKSLFYSTNDYDTAKKGNVGVFSYKSSGGSYDIYWIINFDDGYVYYFTEGNGESTCDRLKIDSGDLNDKIIITYHDGSDVWSYGLHFKYVNHPETLIMQDNDGFEYKYSTTDLSKALSLKNSKTIKDY